MSYKAKDLRTILDDTLKVIEESREDYIHELRLYESGRAISVTSSIAWIKGLQGAGYQELLRFAGDLRGMVFNLRPKRAGVVLLDKGAEIPVGSEVRRTRSVVDVPVGEALLGRVVDAVGRPQDGQGQIRSDERLPIEREAPPMIERDPVKKPLQTGVKAVDALIPIGRGQRELILGDRKTGKTAIAIDTIINQRGRDVACIYCAIGKKSSDIASVIDELKEYDALDYTTVVATSGEDPPGLKFVAPYAACSMGEYFRDRGQDALVIYDDLTLHARAYRELSLLLRRPPAREAYPGDIFYIHSRLLERATHLNKELGGGSLTALPIIETQAQNISAYIPTNLISITDGQIYLSPKLNRQGILPAIDVGKSVSRVGGKTQLPAYRGLAGDLKLAYSQFEELETFSRFSTRLDEETRAKLKRGERVREALKQPQYQPISVPEQIAVLVAVNRGLFDRIDTDQVTEASQKVRRVMTDKVGKISAKIREGEKLSDDDLDKLEKLFKQALDLKDSDADS